MIWLNCSMDRTARRLLEAWVPAHPAGHVQHPDYLKLLSDAVQFVHEWAVGSLSMITANNGLGTVVYALRTKNLAPRRRLGVY